MFVVVVVVVVAVSVVVVEVVVFCEITNLLAICAAQRYTFQEH
jgi:hypothetical protein